MYDRNAPSIDGPESKQPSNFWEQFEQSFDDRTQDVFNDRLHPLNTAGWSHQRPGDSWQDVVERGNRRIKSGLTKSIQYSLRDAAAFIPIVRWFEEREDALSELFVDSVDAVEEESVSPLDPTYQPTERLWWQRLAESRVLRYGLRPFRTSPYAFLSLQLKDADRLVLLGNVRYYFRNLAEHRFELALSLPLANGITVDLGTAYQFNAHDEEQRLVLKLFKPLRGGGIFHLGIDIQKAPRIFAGISLPM